MASSLDGALLNPGGGINANLTAGQSVMLFASNSGTRYFKPGQSYTWTVKLSDGSTKTVNAILF